MQSSLESGLAFFNSRRFFEAHEVLEDLWREAPLHGALRGHLQGLVQLAVAFHHYSTGNLDGAQSVLRRAVRNLNGAEESFPELDLPSLSDILIVWQSYLADCQLNPEAVPPSAMPTLRLRQPEP
jgi:predicted metal-dependent hydrolase